MAFESLIKKSTSSRNQMIQYKATINFVFQLFVLDCYKKHYDNIVSNINAETKTIIIERSLDSTKVFTELNSKSYTDFQFIYLRDKFASIQQEFHGTNQFV